MNSPPGARAHFIAKSAMDALELPIEGKFDIISMSCAITKSDKT
ncbi:uncharacterized protein DNG_06754 [Cephalotrichum gorgonifer]|uniref:Uncharacterized protein n=1 Tax=Cephalotrichum gorgonifer TaxID=2041049 RepID=A0AAE8N099_9PEZI|nr:uncharacterized protein DNG_06754 [Cephalotrichum gorgonifer]